MSTASKPTVLQARLLQGTDLYYASHRGEMLLIKISRIPDLETGTLDLKTRQGRFNGRFNESVSDAERALAAQMCREGATYPEVRMRIPHMPRGIWSHIKRKCAASG